MEKRIACFFLVVLVFIIVGCGRSDSDSKNGSQTESVTTNPPDFVGQNMAKVSGSVKNINADLHFPYFELGTDPELNSPFREGTRMSKREQGGGGIFTGILKKVSSAQLGEESLHPSITYYYRMCVWSGTNEPQNPSHTVCGDILNFTTAAASAPSEVIGDSPSNNISHDGIDRSTDPSSTATGAITAGTTISNAIPNNIRDDRATVGFGAQCGFIFGSEAPINCAIGYTAQVNLPAHSQIGRVELWHMPTLMPSEAGRISWTVQLNIGGAWVTVISNSTATSSVAEVSTATGTWTNVSAMRVMVSGNVNGGDGMHPPGVKHVTYALKAFDTALPHLTLVKSGLGSGLIVGGKVNCGSNNCEVELYDRNTPISRLAVAGSRSVFTGWTTGPCAGSTSIACNFILTADTTITAHFD